MAFDNGLIRSSAGRPVGVALKDFCLSFVGTCRCILSDLKGTCTDGDERPSG
jgi:hypothetical protein